tara:strand:+ start:263 stop:409 length:147 start_codon:yes stop_codon:yes gene_type:complete
MINFALTERTRDCFETAHQNGLPCNGGRLIKVRGEKCGATQTHSYDSN